MLKTSKFMLPDVLRSRVLRINSTGWMALPVPVAGKAAPAKMKIGTSSFPLSQNDQDDRDNP
jgi:hypothetical protein